MNILQKVGIIIPKGIKRPDYVTDVLQPFTVAVNLTPEMAKYWMTNNTMNRPLNKGNVSFYISQMKEGKWQFNGEPIQFDQKANLLNGQHRCEAVIRSGVTIFVNVVVGLEKDSFKTIDTGRPRGAGDVLAIAGVPDYSMAAAAARFIMDFQRGKFNSLGQRSARNSKFNNADILHFCQNTPDFSELIAWARKNYTESGRFLSGKLTAGLCFFFQQTDRFAARDFFRKLCLGVDISQDSPIFLLRRRLTKEKSSRDQRIPTKEKVALIIKTWNFVMEGKTVKQLTYTKNEKFPELFKGN